MRKNEVVIEYEGFTVKVFEAAKQWVCQAFREETNVHQMTGYNRDKLVDEMQFYLDIYLAEEDTSVLVSKVGLHKWLSKKETE